MNRQSYNPQAILDQAVALHKKKRLHEAESLYLTLLEHLPHVPEINDFYALLLTETNRSEAAIPYLEVVAKAAPTERNLMRLAMFCLKHGQNKRAHKNINQLLSNNPDHLEAGILQARAWQAEGQHQQALERFADIVTHHPDNKLAAYHLGLGIQNYRPEKFEPATARIYTDFLARPGVRIEQYFHPVMSFLLCHPDLGADSKDEISDSASWLKKHATFLSLPLLHRLVAESLVISKELELFLTKLRKHYLFLFTDALFTATAFAFKTHERLLMALAQQCFDNEYIFGVTGAEKRKVKALADWIDKNPDADKITYRFAIALRGCYDPLYQTACRRYDFTPLIKSDATGRFKKLVTRQITEPLQEIELARNLPCLNDISDDVSQKVRTLYEQSPYPRWRHYGEITARPFLDYLSRQIAGFKADPHQAPEAPEILVAGGGTGQHPILTARRIENAFVSVIDLSRSSLAYGQRMSELIGVDNIRFYQADILALEAFGKQFDIIESVGVLHHMTDPFAALEKLYTQLKTGGYMKIGLYSRTARRDINRVRDLIKAENIGDDPASIRKFRQNIFTLEESNPISKITKAYDFYSLSNCRDLLFHVQESQFTLPEISEAIDKLGLEFLGFNFPDRHIPAAFKNSYPKPGSEKSLDNWSQFEEKAPNCFGTMYQFWVKKPAE